MVNFGNGKVNSFKEFEFDKVIPERRTKKKLSLTIPRPFCRLGHSQCSFPVLVLLLRSKKYFRVLL